MDEKRNSQISEHQERLFCQLKKLDELTGILSERLKPIRCNVPQPISTEAKKLVKAELSPVAEFLRLTTEMAETTNGKVANLLEEITC